MPMPMCMRPALHVLDEEAKGSYDFPTEIACKSKVIMRQPFSIVGVKAVL